MDNNNEGRRYKVTKIDKSKESLTICGIAMALLGFGVYIGSQYAQFDPAISDVARLMEFMGPYITGMGGSTFSQWDIR